MVRAVAFEARGRGFESSLYQVLFLLGYKEVGKMDLDTIKLRDLSYPCRYKIIIFIPSRTI